MLPFIFVVLLILSPFPQTQKPQSAVDVRPCAISWNAPVESGKKRPKSAAEAPQSQPGACIEVSAPALEVQEYLQSFARQREWSISGEHLGEDSWTFERALSKDELLQFTKRGPDAARIAWTGGTSFIRVSSSTASDGFTRTVIRASFRGFGESPDKFAAQKKYWELESNGIFEELMVEALRAHYQSGGKAAS